MGHPTGHMPPAQHTGPMPAQPPVPAPAGYGEQTGAFGQPAPPAQAPPAQPPAVQPPAVQGPYGRGGYPTQQGAYAQPASPAGYPPTAPLQQTSYMQNPPPSSGGGYPSPYGPTSPYAGLPPVPPPQGRGKGLILALLAGAAVLLLLVGGGTALVVVAMNAGETDVTSSKTPEPTSTGSAPTADATPSEDPSVDIGDRRTDPKPLTATEVFPTQVVSVPGGSPYAILRRDIVGRCGTAAFGTISSQLAINGCNQVARATLIDASKAYWITAGVANMPNAAAVERMDKLLRQTDIRRGFFAPMPAGGAANFVITKGQGYTINHTVVGHYIVYAIIGRADLRNAATTDPKVAKAGEDLLNYGRRIVLKRQGG